MQRSFLVSMMVAALGIGFAGVSGAEDAVARGKQLYTDQKCQLCHSVEGKGNAKGPLDGIGSKLSAADTKKWLMTPKEMAAAAKAERKPPMKAFDTLPAADLDALVAYLQSLKK